MSNTQPDCNSPAVKRGMELMAIPMTEVPRPAMKYAALLSRRLGKCMEVLLSAYTTHAQIVEGLSCEDDLYKVNGQIRADYELAQRICVEGPPDEKGRIPIYVNLPSEPAFPGIKMMVDEMQEMPEIDDRKNDAEICRELEAENAKLLAKLAEALAVIEPLERLLLMSALDADNIVRVVIELSERHGYEVTAKFPEWETRRGPTLAEALKMWSPPNRCPCSFPHPAHDYCDGNPNGSSFGGIAERLGNKPQA